MAARFKKKPPGNDNKLLKLDKLTLFDFMCTICQSIYIEPVTLPCYHDFCLACFNGTIENNALSCPLCRTRIGSWLRTTSKQNKLVNIKLWDFIKEKFPEDVKTKLNGGDIAISEDENVRKISAPGEIRLEYESEILKIKKEQQILEEKHSKETEKLIRELQEEEEQEKKENLAKLQSDEQLARQLADTSRLRGHRRPIHHTPSHTSTASSTPNSSKDFYKHLSNNSKVSTLDSYLVKGSGRPNGFLKNGSAGGVRPTVQGPSPELMSTTGRCGRFLKNFLNGKLWGSGVVGKPTTSKTEPKVWEPQQMCAGHSRELSVRSGVVLHHDSHGGSSAASRLMPCAEPRDSMEGLGEPDTGSEDSLAQELCYFKPLHPAPINRFSGRTMKCTPIRPRARNKSSEAQTPQISQLISGLEKLRRSDTWPHRTQSSFVCLLSVPASYVKEREETEKSRKSSPTSKSDHKSNRRKISPVKNITPIKSCHTKTVSAKKLVNIIKKSCTGTHNEVVSSKELRSSSKKDKISVNNEVTPKKTSPRRSSRSSVKLGSNGIVPNDQALTRSKRSISFGDLRSPTDSTGKKQLDNQLDHSNKLKDKSTNGKPPNGEVMSYIDKDEFKVSIPSSRVLRGNRHLTKSKASDKMDHAITRRMSNQLAEEERNEEDLKLHNNNHNEYLYNGVDGSPKGEGKIIKKNGIVNNDSSDMLNSDLMLDNLDPSLLEEQRRIEEIIAQEKKDFALAKKLQKQLCRNGYGISTGYTMRTATKRQTTLGEMLSTPKKMKV